MRYVAMVSCLMLASAALGSGVCAAVVVREAVPASDLASLAPAETVPLAAGRVVAVDPAMGRSRSSMPRSRASISDIKQASATRPAGWSLLT